MSIMDLKAPVPAKTPDYWRDFADITEKDAANVTQFSASDGHNLTVYEFGAGNRDGVVIVNALNAPFLLMAKLAGELSKRYRVVSWENRGGPYLMEDVAPPTTTLSRQAQDFIEIAAAKKLESFHTVALCSGAPIIAWAAAHAVMPIRSVSLYAPSGAGTADVLSQYQNVFVPMIKQAGNAESDEAKRMAKLLQDFVRARHERDKVNGQISRLTYLNFRELDGVAGFVRVMTDYWSLDVTERHAEFDEMARRHPVMVMHALDDPIVDYTASFNGCVRTRLPKFVLYPTGGHFKLSEPEPDARRDVAAFMAVNDLASADIEWPPLKRGLHLGPIHAADWA